MSHDTAGIRDLVNMLDTLIDIMIDQGKRHAMRIAFGLVLLMVVTVWPDGMPVGFRVVTGLVSVTWALGLRRVVEKVEVFTEAKLKLAKATALLDMTEPEKGG